MQSVVEYTVLVASLILWPLIGGATPTREAVVVAKAPGAAGVIFQTDVVMTNLGFHRAMAEKGIEVVSTAVGDRHVLEAIEERGLSLGGEQSGHVICRELASTGDGVLTGVQLLDVVVRSGRPLSTLASGIMTRVPQVLENVRLPRPMTDPGAAIAGEVRDHQDRFGGDGRILVRASGTEPLLRIMVEHIDERTAAETCTALVAAARTALGAP